MKPAPQQEGGVSEKVKVFQLEAEFNAALTLDIMKVVNPVINDLRIEIVKLREELANLRNDLCL